MYSAMRVFVVVAIVMVVGGILEDASASGNPKQRKGILECRKKCDAEGVTQRPESVCGRKKTGGGYGYFQFNSECEMKCREYERMDMKECRPEQFYGTQPTQAPK